MSHVLPRQTAPEVDAGNPAHAVLPVGSFEQHGPYLPLITDTVVASIGRRAKLVRLATGDALTYDRLVLAMGARSGEPAPNFSSYPNAFMLRRSGGAGAGSLEQAFAKCAAAATFGPIDPAGKLSASIVAVIPN